MASIDLRSLPLEELTAQLKSNGYPAFRAKQIREWLDRGVTDFDKMTNLPKALRDILAEKYPILNPVLALFLGLHVGEGQLRLFMLSGAALGAVLWFALFSALLRPIWDLWCTSLVALCHLLAKPVVFVVKILRKGLLATKKGFSFLFAWSKMKCTPPAEKGEPMAAKTTKTKKRRKTSPLLLLVLAVLIVVLAVQVVNVYQDLADARAQEAALSDSLTEQQAENDALKADLEKKDDTNFIKALARELLGLAEEGERIFYDVNE